MSKYLARIAKLRPLQRSKQTSSDQNNTAPIIMLLFDATDIIRDIFSIVYTSQFAGLHMRNEECYTMEARHCTLALSSPGYCCSSWALM